MEHRSLKDRSEVRDRGYEGNRWKSKGMEGLLIIPSTTSAINAM
jgi:hypothetical protein